MGSEPNSFTSLKKLAKQIPKSQELIDILDQVARDQHDKGAALTAASLVDGAIQEALMTKFSEDSESNLFGPNAPLRPFSAKIRVARALDLFNDLANSDLECIREIRNAFAHTMLPLLFETPEVKAVCARFKAIDHLEETFQEEGFRKWNPDARSRYLISCSCYVVAFHLLSRGIQDTAWLAWLRLKQPDALLGKPPQPPQSQ